LSGHISGQISDLSALVLFVAGIAGGALSAAAGGASFVTFPALILAGLSPLAANTTNFVGLITAQPTALATSYRTELWGLGKRLIPSLVVAGFGGIAGAVLLLHTGESGFAAVVPWLMLLATVMFAAGPAMRAFIAGRVTTPLHGNNLLCLALIFMFSVYCGYFGAGVGMMLLGVLAVFGYDDIHEANAVKNAVVMVSGMVATAIYGLSGPVNWPAALMLVAGSTLGAYAGGIIAKRAPQQALRAGLIGIGALFSAYLFWH
jgi:uncharacterized protein